MEGGTRRGRARTQSVGWSLDIENHDRGILRCEQLHQQGADAITAASDDHDLLLPVPGVALPVVQRALVEEVVRPARQAEVEAYFQPGESLGVIYGEITFAGVSRKEVERKGKCWVEDCLLDDALHDVGGEA